MRVAKVLIDASLMLSMGRIEVVLNTIIGSAWEIFGDVGPFVAKFFVEVKNLLLFIFVDWRLVNVGVQMVMPPDKA